MIALLTACLFFEILVHVLNCISKKTKDNVANLHYNIKTNMAVIVNMVYSETRRDYLIIRLVTV